MKNRFLLSLACSLGGIFALAFALSNNFTGNYYSQVKSDQNHYQLSFNSENNNLSAGENTFIASRIDTYDIHFSSSGLSPVDGSWGALEQDGFFYNTTRISGIESISFEFVEETAAITLWWGWMGEHEDTPIYETSVFLNNATSSTNLYNQIPGCFKVVASADTTIESFTIVYTCSQSSFPNNGIEYSFNSTNQSYWVRSFSGVQNNVVIRQIYDNGVNGEHPVDGINAEAFRDCSSITSISIPDSVEIIGDYAFYGCSSLESINIPELVTSINDSAFGFCSSLTSLLIPDSVTSIGNFAFFSCSLLDSIVFPSSVTSIGAAAFFECNSITTLIVPSNITFIGDGGLMNVGGNVFIEFESMPEEWSSSCLDGSTVYWYSEIERIDGNYWHYMGDVPTPW